MKCIKCDAEIESDDNFCPNCGELTSHGYLFINENPNNINILNGNVTKKESKLGALLAILTLGIIIFFLMINIRGDNMFKPYILLKKQVLSHQYGYNISLIKTDNKYNNIIINTKEEAKEVIRKDIEKQKWQCQNNLNTYNIENELEEKYQITSVSFCDINDEETIKIEKVIDRMFTLFPNSKGYLTNITITNSDSKEDYIAYFEPIYVFVNNDSGNYNLVSKTQILLNSYYFLNTSILENDISNVVGEDFFVKDATYESTIAHELGHYITFVCLLKKNNIDNIMFINDENRNMFNKILNESNNSSLSTTIVDKAIEKYNYKNKINLSREDFAKTISKYASTKDKSGNLVLEETIAEAVHDYYLHGKNAKDTSLEIIEVLKSYLGETE